MSREQISVLFCRADSIYKTLGLDCWDKERDALNWPGGNAIIAHPPCRAWGQLAHFAKPLPGERELALWSVAQIRKNGGVLEHPRASKLWPEMGLPLGGNRDEYGGFSLSVDQHWWGHRARKRTLLYIVGCEPSDIPPYPLRFELVSHVITQKYRKDHPRFKSRVTQKEREATPVDFALWLVELAKKCKIQNHD